MATPAFSSLDDLLRLEWDLLRRLLPRDRQGDKLFSLIQFVRVHNRFPNESMQLSDVLYRIKTSDEIIDPLRVFVTDKEYAKLYIKAVVGDAFNVPTIAILHSREAVAAYAFPADCCIKPTHSSGQVHFRRHGEPLDTRMIADWLDLNHYERLREPNYRHLRPKIIVEPILFETTNITDYKLFCYQGRPKLIQLDFDRRGAHSRKYFTPDWTELTIQLGYPRNPNAAARPDALQTMLDLAARLSSPFSLVRVDFYTDGNSVYVGELTNCHGGANERFESPESEMQVSGVLFG